VETVSVQKEAIQFNPITTLRVSSGSKFERLRIVPTNIPQEKLNYITNGCEVVCLDQNSAPTEKLMPCGMRYPEPIRCKPNFFIPILYVCSYIAPFNKTTRACKVHNLVCNRVFSFLN
jgi:hypothetical protein